MSSPVLGAIGAFLIGILATVLIYQSGVICGPIWILPAHIVTPHHPGKMPLWVSVSPANVEYDARCPPVIRVSNGTESGIFFEPAEAAPGNAVFLGPGDSLRADGGAPVIVHHAHDHCAGNVVNVRLSN